MKKILAIAVATAISAPAMADMTIGGSTSIALGKAGGNYGLSLGDFDVAVSGSQTFGETTVSGAATLQLDGTAASADNNSISIANASFGKLSMAEITAGDAFGVDGLLDVVGNGSDTQLDSVTYTLPTLVEGVTLAVNYLEGPTVNKSAQDLDYRVSTSAAGVDVYFAMRPSTERTRVKLSTTAAGVALGAGYEDNNGAVRTSLSAGYTMGASTVAASWANVDGGDKGYELTFDHDLGSNVALNVTHTAVDGADADTSAEITVSF